MAQREPLRPHGEDANTKGSTQSSATATRHDDDPRDATAELEESHAPPRTWNNTLPWNDDEDGIARELEKTITGSGEDFVALGSAAGLQDDEVKMGLQLFDLVTDNNEDYELKIQGVTDNWDPGRIAIIDLLCIKLALAEFLSFPQVPVKVSINEYLEVVKDYSTPNSGRFLNGVLDKLRIKLEKDGSIQKTGRGLRDK
jgi:N utilization substance protein B